MRCGLCGDQAGFLKREHPECRDRLQAARAKAVGLVEQGACEGERWEGGRWEDLRGRIEETLDAGKVPRTQFPAILTEGIEAAAKKVLDDDLLDEEEERCVLGFIRLLEPAASDASRVERVRERLERAGVLRLVMEGENPFSRQDAAAVAGVRFMKSEQPIWAFEGVDYYTMKKRVTYTGSSRGVSVRVARGVYYRTGGLRGQRHVEEGREHTDSGRLIVTTKHVYFVGTKHRFRVRHDRVVHYEPFQDGFALTRDRANARPEQFGGMDGWFVYNLLMNAEELQ